MRIGRHNPFLSFLNLGLFAKNEGRIAFAVAAHHHQLKTGIVISVEEGLSVGWIDFQPAPVFE